MLNAEIIKNKPHCPGCNKHNYRVTGNAKEFKTSQGNATLMTVTCDECGNKFQYFMQMFVNKDNNYFVEDIANDAEIKEAINK